MTDLRVGDEFQEVFDSHPSRRVGLIDDGYVTIEYLDCDGNVVDRNEIWLGIVEEIVQGGDWGSRVKRGPE